MSLALREGGAQAMNFRLERGDMADGTNGDPPEIVGAAAGFGQLTCILVGRPAFRSSFCSLAACHVRVGSGRYKHSRQQRKLACGASGRVSAREDRHTRHSC